MAPSEKTEVSRQIATPAAYGDCQICKDLWRGFAGVGTVNSINLGSFQEALASGCPGHTPLVQEFQDYFKNADAERRGPEPVDVGILVSSNGSVEMTQSIENLGIYWDLLLVNRQIDADAPSFGTGRILEPDWADLDVVREWKKCCLESHGAACENPMKIWRTRPAWLVDVERNCIVPGKDCDRFVALSYTWGSKPPFLPVDPAMMERLQAPGALEQPEISAHLAPMIRHAIRLTSLIEESYLWVDTVCISHGSYEETSRELLRMGAIYANAVLTIIAADGDSHDGLLGLKGVSNPRELSQRIIPFGDEKIVVRNTGAFSMLGGTRYYERGWTYQELKMSPRKLLFNHKELHWECQCNLWHEELTLGSEAQPYIDSRSREILAGFPDLAALSNIILSYNELELTYDEDALSGILGMLTVFSRSFIGGFLYGLPEMMFDRCLGWQPLWGNTDLRRRVHSGRAGASTLSPSELPSWSWIGWQGQVKAGHEAARHNPREHVSEETTPITTWYTSSSLEATSSLRKIKSTWFQDRIACKDFSRPLPPGWTRHSAASAESFRQEPHLSPDGCGEFVFRHCNMEDDDKSSWYYPFPAADIRESTPPSMPEQTRYLFCETKKGRLWGRRVPTNSERDELLEQNILGLFSESGTKVGTLHLHGEEHLNSFPDNAIDDEQGRGIELVAIYKSRRYSKTWNEALQRYDHPIEVKDFYKVLWVEWEGRVAYRLASGMVELAAWESLDLENISLVLG